MVKINQSLHRLQVAWREAQQSSSPAADGLREQFERLMTIYLSTKAAMTEPQLLQNCLNLQVSMAVLLVQLALGNRGTEPLELSFPLPAVENSALAYVPGEPRVLRRPVSVPSQCGAAHVALRLEALRIRGLVPSGVCSTRVSFFTEARKGQNEPPQGDLTSSLCSQNSLLITWATSSFSCGVSLTTSWRLVLILWSTSFTL